MGQRRRRHQMAGAVAPMPGNSARRRASKPGPRRSAPAGSAATTRPRWRCGGVQRLGPRSARMRGSPSRGRCGCSWCRGGQRPSQRTQRPAAQVGRSSRPATIRSGDRPSAQAAATAASSCSGSQRPAAQQGVDIAGAGAHRRPGGQHQRRSRDDHRAAAALAVRTIAGSWSSRGVEDDRAVAQLGQAGDALVGGVEHREAVGSTTSTWVRSTFASGRCRGCPRSCRPAMLARSVTTPTWQRS
jgi:hypothetical protein